MRHVVSDVRAVLAEVHWTFDEKHDAVQGARVGTPCNAISGETSNYRSTPGDVFFLVPQV